MKNEQSTAVYISPLPPNFLRKYGVAKFEKSVIFSVKYRIQLARLPYPHAPGWVTPRNSNRNFATENMNKGVSAPGLIITDVLQ